MLFEGEYESGICFRDPCTRLVDTCDQFQEIGNILIPLEVKQSLREINFMRKVVIVAFDHSLSDQSTTLSNFDGARFSEHRILIHRLISFLILILREEATNTGTPLQLMVSLGEGL
jgi:hypothetical protein